MSWETWTLVLLIVALVTLSVWGFMDAAPTRNSRFLRLAYIKGEGCLYVPASGRVGWLHQGRHRAGW